MKFSDVCFVVENENLVFYRNQDVFWQTYGFQKHKCLVTVKYYIKVLVWLLLQGGRQNSRMMKPCDDEDCVEGSGSAGEQITEPDHPATT